MMSVMLLQKTNKNHKTYSHFKNYSHIRHCTPQSLLIQKISRNLTSSPATFIASLPLASTPTNEVSSSPPPPHYRKLLSFTPNIFPKKDLLLLIPLTINAQYPTFSTSWHILYPRPINISTEILTTAFHPRPLESPSKRYFSSEVSQLQF